MSVQIFRLRNVPDDEAEEIRQLLANNNFEFYETPAGNWGISMPAIWLHDAEQKEEAKALIDQYQIERQKRVREERNQNRTSSENESILSELFSNPIRFIVYTAFAVVILYFSIKPFLNFGQ